jgi:hypothetical protein
MVLIKSILSLFLFLLPLLSLPQESLLHQDKPLNKNPGRIVKLKEQMRITDDQGGFFLRYPKDLKVTPDGDIFFMDYNQLLRFNKSGKLLNNYYKKGQGPAELVSMKNYILYDDSIIVCNNRPVKILWFNKEGPYLKEFRVRKRIFSGQLITLRNNRYYFITSGIPRLKGESAFTYNHYKLVEISDEGENITTLTSFPVKTFVINLGGGRASKGLGQFISKVYNDKLLVLSHTQEYLVKIYNIEKKKLVTVFSRKYERVKPTSYLEDDFVLSGKKFDELKQKYLNDIKNILINRDEIWVVTSTENKIGTLIDIFDLEGHYLDSFYIKLKGGIMAVCQDSIFVRQLDENTNAVIVKYSPE